MEVFSGSLASLLIRGGAVIGACPSHPSIAKSGLCHCDSPCDERKLTTPEELGVVFLLARVVPVVPGATEPGEDKYVFLSALYWCWINSLVINHGFASKNKSCFVLFFYVQAVRQCLSVARDPETQGTAFLEK